MSLAHRFPLLVLLVPALMHAQGAGFRNASVNIQVQNDLVLVNVLEPLPKTTDEGSLCGCRCADFNYFLCSPAAVGRLTRKHAPCPEGEATRIEPPLLHTSW